MTEPLYLLTKVARSDLGEILDYVSADSVDAALRVHDRFIGAFDMLASNPGCGHLRSDLTSRPVRFFPVFSYLVVYLDGSDPLTILRILCMARDVAQILEDPPVGDSRSDNATV